MLKGWKQRLTWRDLIRMGSALLILIIAYMWLTKTPIPIEGIEEQHEQLLAFLSALGAVIVLGFTFIFPHLSGDRLIFAPISERPLSDDKRRQNRQDMLKLVEKIWITGFLDNALNQMNALKLGMQFAEPEKTLQRPGLADYTLPTTADIHRVYKELNRRLVILGEAGAGKTVLLLQLASELIHEAGTDEHKSIPVIFTLSSWAAARQMPFEEWLKQELRGHYGLSQAVAHDLVAGEQLLYLFDGLDEVAADKRKACLKAIKLFVQERPVDYVLTCRRKEFGMLSTRLEILGEIVIQPLKTDQINDYLRGTEFVALRAVMFDTPVIRDDFARIPFMLNTMAVVARNLEERTLRMALDAHADPARLRDYFLENYLNRRLREHIDRRYPDFRRSRTYLKWLASCLIKHKQTDFYIENMQLAWLSSVKQRKRYRSTSRWVLGVWFGVVTGLGMGLLFGPMFGLTMGVLIGLGTVVAMNLMDEPQEKIMIVDYIDLAFNRDWLMAGLGIGLLFGFGLSFMGRLQAGLMSGLLLLMITGLIGGLTSRTSVSLWLLPNAGIRRSLVNFYRMVLLFGLIGGLWMGLAIEPLTGLVSGLTIGLIAGVIFGGETVIQHIILRGFLAADGFVPRWRYDSFLNYATDLVILRRVGGGYRFVHDYLRQYLASSAFVPDAVTSSQEISEADK